jgi:hypothetical protein
VETRRREAFHWKECIQLGVGLGMVGVKDLEFERRLACSRFGVNGNGNHFLKPSGTFYELNQKPALSGSPIKPKPSSTCT